MPRIAILHEQWLAHPDVTADEIAVLCVLSLHANRNNECFPSQGLVASILGRSRPWVSKVISRLVALGIVVRTHRTRHDGGHRSCHYRLVPPLVSEHRSPARSATDHNANAVPCPAVDELRSHNSDEPVSSGNTVFSVQNCIKTEKEITRDTHAADTTTDPSSLVIALATALVVPPEDWQPSDDDLIWAITTHPTADPETHTERFLQRCQAKGYRYRRDGIGMAWRSWLTDDLKRQTPGNRVQPRQSLARTKFDAWATVAARATEDRRHAA